MGMIPPPFAVSNGRGDLITRRLEAQPNLKLDDGTGESR